MAESKKAIYQSDIRFGYYKLIFMYFSKHLHYAKINICYVSH